MTLIASLMIKHAKFLFECYNGTRTSWVVISIRLHVTERCSTVDGILADPCTAACL